MDLITPARVTSWTQLLYQSAVYSLGVAEQCSPEGSQSLSLVSAYANQIRIAKKKANIADSVRDQDPWGCFELFAGFLAIAVARIIDVVLVGRFERDTTKWANVHIRERKG